jgi:biotin-(acetyl-CoA carboxylase) ligase
LEPSAIEPTLERVLERLETWLAADRAVVLDAVRGRDALFGRSVRWAGGRGVAAGIDGAGRLVVRTEDGEVALDAGEVHLVPT